VLIGILAGSACGASADDRQRLDQVYDETGKLQLLKYDADGNGTIETWSYMDGPRIVRIEIDGNEDGTIDRWEYYTGDQQIEKVGTSRARDGKVDSWAYYATDGSMARLERSMKRDGKEDRTEYYENGRLIRAEEETNGDSQTDKWESNEGTRLASVAFDTKHRGTADRRLLYGPDGTVRLEVAPNGDGRFVPAAPAGSSPSR
jgi:hypothetical protein